MNIELTLRFVRQYQKLSGGMKTRTDKALLALLESDFKRPGLDSHRVGGVTGVFETAIESDYRLTYERCSDTFILRNLDVV